jgi:outer membrane protein assembly factor BamD (BamD/ComL family)
LVLVVLVEFQVAKKAMMVDSLYLERLQWLAAAVVVVLVKTLVMDSAAVLVVAGL